MMAGKALRKAFRIPGCLPALRRLRSRQIAIVMYHSVTPRETPVFNWCQLGSARFRQQVEFLAARYSVLPLSEVLARLATGAPLPRNVACLTFDDGFRSVCTTAYPILAKRQMPATVFLVTSLVGTRQPAWPEQLYHAIASSARSSISFEGVEWPLATNRERAAANTGLAARLKRMDPGRRTECMQRLVADLGAPPPVDAESPLATMDWQEIEQLSKTGLFAFGSHTHTHPILSRCEEAVQREELQKSRDILLERLGNADLFAYPNGTRADFTSVTKRILAELGYRCGLSTTPGLNSSSADLYELRRVNVGANMDFGAFEIAMTGF